MATAQSRALDTLLEEQERRRKNRGQQGVTPMTLPRGPAEYGPGEYEKLMEQDRRATQGLQMPAATVTEPALQPVKQPATPLANPQPGSSGTIRAKIGNTEVIGPVKSAPRRAYAKWKDPVTGEMKEKYFGPTAEQDKANYEAYERSAYKQGVDALAAESRAKAPPMPTNYREAVEAGWVDASTLTGNPVQRTTGGPALLYPPGSGGQFVLTKETQYMTEGLSQDEAHRKALGDYQQQAAGGQFRTPGQVADLATKRGNITGQDGATAVRTVNDPLVVTTFDDKLEYGIGAGEVQPTVKTTSSADNVRRKALERLGKDPDEEPPPNFPEGAVKVSRKDAEFMGSPDLADQWVTPEAYSNMMREERARRRTAETGQPTSYNEVGSKRGQLRNVSINPGRPSGEIYNGQRLTPDQERYLHEQWDTINPKLSAARQQIQGSREKIEIRQRQRERLVAQGRDTTQLDAEIAAEQQKLQQATSTAQRLSSAGGAMIEQFGAANARTAADIAARQQAAPQQAQPTTGVAKLNQRMVDDRRALKRPADYRKAVAELDYWEYIDPDRLAKDPAMSAAVKQIAAVQDAVAIGKADPKEGYKWIMQTLKRFAAKGPLMSETAAQQKQSEQQRKQAVANVEARRKMLVATRDRQEKRLAAMETRADRLEAQARKLGDDARIRYTNKQNDEANGLWAEEKKVADEAKAIRVEADELREKIIGDNGLDAQIAAVEQELLAAQGYEMPAAPDETQQQPAGQPGETIWDKAAPSVIDLATGMATPRTATPAAAQPPAPAATVNMNDPQLSMAERQQRARMWLNAVKSQGVVEQPGMQPVRPISPNAADAPEYDPFKARSIIDTALASAEKALAAGGDWEDQAAALQPLMQQLSPNDLARLARLRDKYRR